MSFMEIGQSLWVVSQAADGLGHVVNGHLADGILAGLAAPDPGPSEVDTDGILSFFASKIAPILLAVLGVIFIGRASKGEVSRVLTSSAIAIIGLAFIAGAATLFFVGESLIDLVFK
jgi:hypothetical protein